MRYLIIISVVLVIVLASCSKASFHDDTWGETNVLFINATPDTILIHLSYDGLSGGAQLALPGDTVSWETWRYLGTNLMGNEVWTTCWQEDYWVEHRRSGNTITRGTINSWVIHVN